MISRLKLSGYIILRSGIVGLISGSVLGGLFGLTLFAFIWTGMVGAGLGLGLGLINGLLLSAIVCLFFYPLKYIRSLYVTLRLISIFIPAGGAAVFAPWYFSSTPMTPSSAVFIGLNSVMASIVAGWAGGLTGQNIAQWYRRQSMTEVQRLVTTSIFDRATNSNQQNQNFAATFLTEKFNWATVALFALLCPFPVRKVLEFLVCGRLDVFYCFASPRLYTSVVGGFKVAFPIIFLVLLIVLIIQSQGRKHI
ncbi:hypothetical protein FLX56_17470 [Synechococcus moorigangaii CMS01]|nr:hypothetical protein [Synechococcus moorigangaii CMS01]